MKNNFLLLLISLFVAQNTIAQHGCITNEYYQNKLATDIVFKKNQEALEKFTQEFIANKANQKSVAPTYIIPIVFHVIYSTPNGNISSAQIVNQVDILNKEFMRKQADTILTPSAFLPFAGKFNVEFRLATKDPNGNCTNGINRIYSTLSACSIGSDDVKALSYWPTNSYLNIWLVETMHYPWLTSCNGGGYATFPGGAPNLDGINIRSDLIGSIGTAATNSSFGNFKGRYLIHELGHWFNLRHIWGDATCGNDFVADTPPALTSNNGCPPFPRNNNNSCGANANGEMFNNYMDYTNGNCLNMFTQGQVIRMDAAINSSISGRNNLWSNANLLSTGTADPYIYPLTNCVANPDILPLGPLVTCVGDSVKFTDNSYGGIATARNWSFTGGNASSLTDSIVKVVYNTPGVYNVTLSKTFSSATKTNTFVNKVHVLNPVSAVSLPITEGFENQGTVFLNWRTINKNNDASKWDFENNTSYSGSYCYALNNFSQQGPSTDEFITPGYDFSAVSSVTVSFRYSYAEAAASPNDRFEISVSKDCGKTWIPYFWKTGASLKTVTGTVPSSFMPGIGTTEWKLENTKPDDFDIGAQTYFRFSFTNGGNGNNIFIDDININGLSTVGFETNTLNKNAIRLFPNPTNNVLTIQNKNISNEFVTLKIIDVLGKLVYSEKYLQTALNKLINVSNFNTGAYRIILENADVILDSKTFVKMD